VIITSASLRSSLWRYNTASPRRQRCSGRGGAMSIRTAGVVAAFLILAGALSAVATRLFPAVRAACGKSAQCGKERPRRAMTPPPSRYDLPAMPRCRDGPDADVADGFPVGV